MAGDGDPKNLKMENIGAISWLECQYAKRYLFYTLAGRWGEAGTWVLGRKGRGWFGVKGGVGGAPRPKKNGRGPSCKVRRCKKKTGRPMIPK